MSDTPADCGPLRLRQSRQGFAVDIDDLASLVEGEDPILPRDDVAVQRLCTFGIEEIGNVKPALLREFRGKPLRVERRIQRERQALASMASRALRLRSAAVFS